MARSGNAFADEADRLAGIGRVLAETRDRVLVDGLTGKEVRALLPTLDASGVQFGELSDEAGPVPPDALRDDAENLRLVALKPAAPDEVEHYLTGTGFEASLRRPQTTSRVWLTGLPHPVETMTVRYAAWGDEEPFAPAEPPDPARVVRILGSRPPVEPIGRWLLRDHQTDVGAPPFAAWRRRSMERLAEALAQEIEPDGQLLFRGPPPTRFRAEGAQRGEAGAIAGLHRTAGWVYENARELENRHGLVAAEVARSPLRGGNLNDLAATAGAALEGARIAYNFGVTEQSRETLKALGDLRKSVADETAKLAESTRAMATAVAGAVFGNVGLIVARLTLPAQATFVHWAAAVIAVVLALYVASVIASGARFLAIQRDLRADWRNRLYRFLPDDEYEAMVAEPARKAEAAFRLAAIAGGVLTALVFVATLLIIARA